MELKCVIIDDEPRASLILATFAERVGDIKILGTFDTLKGGFDYLQSIDYDVDFVFLDVRLQKEISLDYLIETGEDKLIDIVFTSAYEAARFRDKNVRYFDWLEKPIPYRLFEALIQKIRISKQP